MRTDDELSIFSIGFDGNSSLLFGQGEEITLSCICYVCKLIKRHNPDWDLVINHQREFSRMMYK